MGRSKKINTLTQANASLAQTANINKSKLDNLKQVDGDAAFEKTTIDQILGDTGMSKYKTFDLENYKTSLADMNKSDLQTHAAKMGVMPIDDRRRLTDRLIREFQVHVASYQRPKQQVRQIIPSKEALAIMAEGR